MRKLIALIAAMVILPSASLYAANLQSIDLKSLDFAALPGDKVEVRLTFDGAPPKADGYTIEQPARIALDLPGVKNSLSQKTYSLGYGNARSLTVLEAQGRTRLIVNLSKLVPHSVRTEGNSMYILVGAGEVTTAAKPQQQQNNNGSSSTAAASSGSGLSGKSVIAPKQGIQGVDFRRGDDGEGNVVITLGDPHTAVDINQAGDKITVVLGKAGLPPALKRRMDVNDFATPVKFVDATEQGGDAVVTIEAAGSYEQMTYQTDNTLTVSVKPLTADELEKKKKDNFQYSGDKLSLNFQDIEVRSVLQLIADFTGLNLVASDTVSGRITLRLQNVPWDQALDLVLKTKGLDKRKVGNVLLVAPAAEIAAREKLEIETNKQVAELAPLKQDTIRLRYAKVADLVTILGGCAAGAKAGEGDRGLISGRGTCISDTRTNTILLNDTAENIAEIRRVVEVLDVPVRQVLIESRIVTANVNYSKDIGVEWTASAAIGTNWFATGDRGESRWLDENGDTILGKAVDLNAAGATSGLGIGYIGNNVLLALQLNALESDDKGQVVSQPKVVTADGKKAKIESGQEIAYTTETDDSIQTEFKDAVLSLEVTPQITPDDRVIMDIVITNDQVGEVINGEPSIDTNSVETQALVRNGETVVLGGIFKTDDRKTISKVPFLGDVPVIGQLFRREIKDTQKRELLIFITPKILKEDLTVD